VTRKLTAAGEAVLDSKTVPIKFSVKIAGVANPDVISYDYRFDRNFGASNITVTLLNEDGKYSPGQPEEIPFGATVELEEGLYTVGGHEDFNKFYGIVRQIRPSLRSGQNIVVITAFDYIIKLEDWEIEKEFEANKVAVSNEVLDPVLLPQPNMAQIFDANHNDWAEHPMPIIKIFNKTDLIVEPMWQGFEISYEEGQIVLGTPLNVANFEIRCSYHYYPAGKFVEDIIEEIITIPDGYGNSFSSTTYLRESFTSFTGLSTDIMTPNYAEETIGGTTYAAGRLWYLSYNNLTTTLSSGNFTVPGASIQAIDKRYGRIRLNHSISLTAVVTCNVNYTFKTIQATGIEVPYINFTSRKTKNRFEALRQIRELVAPNYLIRTIGTKKIWATYINQKYNPDYELKLPTAMSYAEDQDIYTRVKVFGKNLNPTNLMLGRSVHFEDLREDYTGYAYQQELTYLKGWGDWEIDPGAVEIQEMVGVWGDKIGPDYHQWSLSRLVEVNDNPPVWYPSDNLHYKFSEPPSWGGGCHPDWPVEYDGSGGHYVVPDSFHSEEATGSARTPMYDVHGLPRWIGIEFDVLFRKHDWNHTSRPPRQVRIGMKEYTSALSESSSTYSEFIVWPKAGETSVHWNEPINMSGVSRKMKDNTYFVRFWITIEQGWSFFTTRPFPYACFTFSVLTEAFVDSVRIVTFEKHDDGDTNSEDDWVEYKVFPALAEQKLRILTDPYPIVYLNGVKIGAGNPVPILSSQVLINRIISYPSVERQHFKYVIIFSHSGISRHHNIKLYKADGSLWKIVAPYSIDSQHIKYEEGKWELDTGIMNEDIEQLSTAAYYVGYSSNKVDFDFNAGIFKVHKSLLNRQQRTDIVSASFAYETMMPLPQDIGLLSDARWTTQCQLEFFGQPLKGLPLFTVDLASQQRIDAIDLTSGFYKPGLGLNTEEMRRFDVSNWFTLEYSLNGTDFYPVCEKANNFHLGGGESVSFEEGDLPELFEARYFRLILEESNKIDFEEGRWCVAICEFAIYKNLILKGEARLIPTHSGEDETHIYDSQGMLDTVGDKLYKVATVNPILSTQARIDRRVGRFLTEFQKEHTKATVDVMYAPHIELGQTVKVIDVVNGVDQNYFIEGVSNNKGKIALNLAYYPGLYS